MTTAMPDAHYDNARLAALYDVMCGWSEDRHFYLGLPAAAGQDILDLGCGTGLICRAWAEAGHAVTGVDPSQSMLDVGRRSAGGDAVDWVCASAETYRSDKRFELVVMTGHAFQVLLDDDAIEAAFETMRLHLRPDGLAVFESRNRAIDWASRWHGATETIDLPGGTVQYANAVLETTGDHLTFEQTYRFPDQTLTSRSVLNFPSRERIATLLDRQHLRVEHLWGDWRRGAFDPSTSDEMVFAVRHAG